MPEMTTLREILRIAGFGGCWAAFVVLLIIWTQAFVAPSRMTIVGVNWSGEGLLELIQDEYALLFYEERDRSF